MQRLPAHQDHEELSLPGVSPDVLKQIPGLVPGSDTLILRSELALVNRSFAAAVKDLSAVTILDSNLPGTSRVLSQAAKAHFRNIFGCVQHLRLSTEKVEGYGRICGVAICCPAVQTLTICLESPQCTNPGLDHASMVTELANELWLLLTQHSPLPQLRKLTVSDKHGEVWLHAAAAEGRLGRQVEVLEGHLGLLERLIVIRSQLDYTNMPGLHGAMLELMPSLRCISGVGSYISTQLPSMGTLRRPCYTLEVPFKGTVRGTLQKTSLKAFQQASIAHCNGLHHLPEDEELPILNAVRTCKGMVQHHKQAVAECVPRLELLEIKIRHFFGPLDKLIKVFSTPYLTSIDVSCHVGEVLLVHGVASQDLMHLQLVGSVIIVEPDLYDWLNARYAKALVASANAAASRNESNQFVVKSLTFPGFEKVSLSLQDAP